MLHVQCPGCLTSAYIDCGCAGLGHDPAAAGQHHPECAMAAIGANVACPPGAPCCGQDHDHDAAANACDAAHDGDCHADNPDCAVCRPLIITALPGAAVLHPAGG